MDTNICLYCESPLEDDTEFIGFCSKQCHNKELLKTKVPTWAVLHSIHRRMHRLPFILAPQTHKSDTSTVSSSPIHTTPIQSSTSTIYIPVEQYPLLTTHKYPTSITTTDPTSSSMHLYLHTLTTKL